MVNSEILFTTGEAIGALKKMGFINPSRGYLVWYFTEIDSRQGVRWTPKYDLEEVRKAFEEGQIFERLEIYGSLKAIGVSSRFQHFENIKAGARKILNSIGETEHVK